MSTVVIKIVFVVKERIELLVLCKGRISDGLDAENPIPLFLPGSAGDGSPTAPPTLVTLSLPDDPLWFRCFLVIEVVPHMRIPLYQ